MLIRDDVPDSEGGQGRRGGQGRLGRWDEQNARIAVSGWLLGVRRMPHLALRTGRGRAPGPVAQLAEQQTLNLRVEGSIPSRLTSLRSAFSRRLSAGARSA